MQIVDLTLAYAPIIKGFSTEVAKSLSVDGWNASTLHIYSHAGTHMDAPYHFEVTNERIDEIPVSRFISDAWVVPIAIHESQQMIQIEDFDSVATKIKESDSIILKTGWHQYIGQDKYRNELPRISEKLAKWLVAKKINILAVEPCSVADVNNLPEVTLIHQILLGGNIIIVEGLCNTENLTAEKVQLIALPLKIHQGDGAPARVIAIQK
jgi:arylformamidase